MFVYDCEVFIKDWMFVFKDVDTLEEFTIINDRDKLINFFNQYYTEIFIGYNSRHYDQYIFKGIMLGLNPKDINDFIIEKGMNGGFYDRRMKDILILNYDCQIDKLKSLKQLEGFMGNDIRETTVPFNIDRKLTKEELKEVEKYCKHDVRQTLEVFNKQREEFDSHMSLVTAFEMPQENLNKTKAQLSAIILGAENKGIKDDEFELTLPNTLKLSEKYKYIKDWYTNPKHFNYKLSLNTKVMGVPHKFAWGGVHGSKDNYIGEGYFIMSDVASLYPSIMIEYNCLSRNVPYPEKFREIRDERIRLKKIKDPRQLPMKIVLNSTYGASKDKYNALFDPLMANNVCVTGQLLLLDLIDKLELEFGDECELIQSNTDGILVKLPNNTYFDRYTKVCDEWCKRTRLDLEHDVYVKVIQKDVNNYIIVDEKGKMKSKGAYVKKLNDLDYDLPIINKALIQKLVNNISIEETILNCDDLKEFQKIIKLSGKYKTIVHNNQPVTEKVLRVFASTNVNDTELFKVKEETLEKVANTPDHCFIYNDNVNTLKCNDNLNKQWYIDLANKRYSDFMEREKKLNEIDFYDLIQEEYDDFLTLIRDIKSKTELKQKELDMLIKLGYFEQYGSIKKLLQIVEINKVLTNKKAIDKDKLDKLGISLDFASKYGRFTTKQIKDLNSESLINDYISTISNDEYDYKTILKLQKESCDTVTHMDSNVSKYIMYIDDIDSKYNVKLYSIRTGKKRTVKIRENIYMINPFSIGDVVEIIKIETLINKYGIKEWWINDYIVK